MSDESLVVRSVTFDAPPPPAAIEALLGLGGVTRVERLKPRRLRIAYDVRRITWLAVRNRLADLGQPRPTGRLARWHDAWRDFTDQNMRDNLNHRPACCSKPPPGAGHR